MRRSIITAAAISAAMLLAACGGGGSGEEPTSEETTTEAPADGETSEEPAVRGEGDLVIWADAGKAPAVQEVANAYGEANGITVECADADYRGYPFRIGLFCSQVAVDDRNNGISATLGALRSAAQVYDPGQIVWEVDAPAQVRTSHGLTVSSTWENFQSSLTAKNRGIERSSTIIDAATTSVVSSGQSFNLSAERTEMHLRQNGQDLDAALSLQNARTTAEGLPELLPPMTATVDVTLAGRAGLIDGSDPNGIALYGTQGEMRRLSADLGEGRIVTVTGPFSIDEEGYLSGRLKLQVEQIDAWRNSLALAFPDLAPVLQTAGGMLSAL